MKVLHLCSTTTLDTHYFRLLGSGLASAGAEILIGTLGPATRPAAWDGGAGPRTFSLGLPSRWTLPLAALRLFRLLRRERPDIVQTHLFDAALVGYAGARLAGIPVVVTRHHTDEVAVVGGRHYRFLDRYVSRRADHVIGLSETVRRYAVQCDGVPGDRASAVRQGFDFAALSPKAEAVLRTREEFGLADRFVIGCVARFFPNKGHRYLVEAFARFAEGIPSAHLLLVGGGDESPVRADVLQRGLGKRVTFTGPRRDVPALMGTLDVLVHPSLSEAFCQVIIEAMAARVPVIATDVGSAREVIEDGRSGYLVPARDPGAIEGVLRRLHAAPGERAEVGRRGRESVSGRFTVPHMVADQLALYRKLMEASSRQD
jgi:glycosyltransferase involved in cell wall biosynthesis